MGLIEDEIAAGLKEAFKGSNVNTEGSEFANILTGKEPIVDTGVPASTGTIPDSSLTDEAAKLAAESQIKNEPVITDLVAQKSFEELLAEKSSGKYKTLDEIEAIISSTKDNFVDEEVKHWNELKKSGVKLDAEFFELQAKNFEDMTDPVEILKESLKRKPENQGLSQRVIDFELNKKYNLSEWAEKDEEDYTEEDLVNRERIMRDAEVDRDWLVDYKKTRAFAPEVNEEQIARNMESERSIQANWNKFVDEELAQKTSKLSTRIDDKESVDFEVSEADRKYAADMMKEMRNDVTVFWNQFLDKDGNMNQKAVFEAIIRIKNQDNIVKVAHQNAMARGKEAEVKNIKNVNFSANETTPVAKVDWRAKAQAQVESNM